MDDYREVSGTINVPKGTGVEGFLETIRQLLRRPRVQEIRINGGKVNFRRFAKPDEEDGDATNNFGVDLHELHPYYVIRNAEVKELRAPQDVPAPVVIGWLFERAAFEKLRPVAFVTGEGTTLWEWYLRTTGHQVVMNDQFFGVPILPDRFIPDDVLLLCAGFGRDAAFIDTRVSYKVQIPQGQALTMETQVP